MENVKPKPLTHSETFQWIAVTVVVYLVRQFGLPALPEGVQGEVINIIGNVIDLAIPVMLGFAAKARMKARAIVDRVF